MKSEHIYLRALEPEDIKSLYIWENDPAIWKISSNSTMFSMKDLKLFVESSHKDIHSTLQKRFMIVRIEDDLAIGTVDLYDFDPHNRRAYVGLMIYENEHQNRGYASEAMNLIKIYAFDILHLNQIVVVAAVTNTGSIRMFEKTGFKRCAEKKEWLLVGRKWLDAVEYQFLAKDFSDSVVR